MSEDLYKAIKQYKESLEGYDELINITEILEIHHTFSEKSFDEQVTKIENALELEVKNEPKRKVLEELMSVLKEIKEFEDKV